MEHYINGIVTSGSCFTYNGVRYGRGTQVEFTKEFLENTKMNAQEKIDKFGYYTGGNTTVFHSIEQRNGQLIWKLNYPSCTMCKPYEYINIVPNRDIAKIIIPVWYYEPKELTKQRLGNGTWIFYVWKQTLIYTLCLLISPIFQEWYLIWTIGLYLYLRLCYIELSKGELNRGW